MSVSFFEIHRIWDVWPNIKNQQVLRDLFRQMHSNSPRQEFRISNVFVIPGHLFVATSSKEGVVPKDRASLYVFSCAPLSEPGQSHDNHVTTASTLELSRQCTEVLNVIDGSKDGRQQIYVVENNGELVTYVYKTIRNIWTLNESYQLTTKPNMILHSCCYMPLPNSTRQTSRVFLYTTSETPPPSSNSTHSSYKYQVILKRCEIAPNGSFIMGQSTMLMESCPMFKMVDFSDGVCFLPKCGPYPKNLLLFWAPGKRNSSHSLRAYVWNLTTPTPSPYDSSPSPSSSVDFKSIILRLAATWSKVPDDARLVSLTSHPVTGQLLALDSNGRIYTLSVAITGTIIRHHLISLSDFSVSSTSTPSLFSFPPTTAHLQLFSIYTCYGVVINGDIRLYDSFSGEFLWESNEHDGEGLQFWSTPKSPGCCGLYGHSGVWIIRCQKVSDHAHFMARGMFPVKTNADETTPGNYLDNGQLIAAKLCKLWGLHLLATKYALEGAYDTMKPSEEHTNGPRRSKNVPNISPEVISLLDDQSSLQNPALLVSLLAEFPVYREELTKRVKRFLENYHKNLPDQQVNNTATPLNRELVPLFERYVEISEEIELLSIVKSRKETASPDVRSNICELLKKSENIHIPSMDTKDSLRPLVHSLCDCHPDEALLGIKDYFGVTSFQEAVEQLESGQWNSEKNWKDIFATEVALKVERNYLKATIDHIPIFEKTCRLLYRSCPDELLTFMKFAQLVRDHQAQGDSAFTRKCRKDFFCCRAINALPAFVSMEDTPTKPEAIRVYCELLLNSDHLNSEMMSLQLLLNNQLWEDAIKLVEKNNSDNHCFLYHTLLNGLNQGGVLNQYIDRAWKILPSKFSVFDFLNILKNNSPTRITNITNIEVPDDSSVLTVSSVAPKILELLQQVATELIEES